MPTQEYLRGLDNLRGVGITTIDMLASLGGITDMNDPEVSDKALNVALTSTLVNHINDREFAHRPEVIEIMKRKFIIGTRIGRQVAIKRSANVLLRELGVSPWEMNEEGILMHLSRHLKMVNSRY